MSHQTGGRAPTPAQTAAVVATVAVTVAATAATAEWAPVPRGLLTAVGAAIGLALWLGAMAPLWLGPLKSRLRPHARTAAPAVWFTDGEAAELAALDEEPAVVVAPRRPSPGPAAARRIAAEGRQG
jgi:hypothetical protein